MKGLKKFVVTSICIFLGISVWNCQEITSRAEDIMLPGYHVYTTTEKEVIDSWYGIAKGTYLVNGTVGLVEAGKGKVNISGTTNASAVCDKVKAAVYLDQSSSGTSGYGTIGSYYFEEANARSCHGSKANISVTSGWWYLVRGVHTVKEGSVTETTSTQTSAMKVS